jgi:hypothetical protein
MAERSAVFFQKNAARGENVGLVSSRELKSFFVDKALDCDRDHIAFCTQNAKWGARSNVGTKQTGVHLSEIEN